VDCVQDAFDLAEKYRTFVLILLDGFMGQMMEAVDIQPRPEVDPLKHKDWALGYRKERGKRRVILSMELDPDRLEAHSAKLQEKYKIIRDNEQRFEHFKTDDAELILTAYGTTSRICRSAILKLREEGFKVGMIRPISLWPFPERGFESLPSSLGSFLDVEMSSAFQMVNDVRLATSCRFPVHTYGRWGGYAPSVTEVAEAAKKILAQ
jgi:2-oxoglutarate ferredoxin oxidoreductase subunit alpha